MNFFINDAYAQGAGGAAGPGMGDFLFLIVLFAVFYLLLMRPQEKRTKEMPEGEIPNPINPPSGCRFHPRCPIAEERCSMEEPEFRELTADHFVACHFAEKFL